MVVRTTSVTAGEEVPKILKDVILYVSFSRDEIANFISEFSDPILNLGVQ